MKPTKFAAVLLVAAVAGTTAVRRVAAQQRSNYEELQTFSGVLNYIRLNYVDSVSYHQLVRAAINGMLHALDPHSRFVSADDWQRTQEIDSGDLATVGVDLEDVDGMPTVLDVAPDSPADDKGIRAGDRLVAIDDTMVTGGDADSLMLRLAGPKGSKVRMTLERGSRIEPDSFRITVKRDYVLSRSVTLTREVAPGIGYIRLAQFGDNAADEMKHALGDVTHHGAKKVILDLRRNPGGVVESSVDVASLFFPKHTLVFRTRGRKSEVDQDFVTKRDGKFRNLPLIVLVDEGSASAAEALAASLQDHDRALLIGRRTFGKALEQSVFLLPDGDHVWLTVGRVLTPSGRFIQRRYVGIGMAQYWSLAGRPGAARDTLQVYHTDHGRVVRGGGGIEPDVVMAPSPDPPTWWSVASDSGFQEAVADSLAYTLSKSDSARRAWEDTPSRWGTQALAPFLASVRSRFGIPASADSAMQTMMARALATRVVAVRWGEEARVDFVLAHDRDVREAIARFPDLARLLASGPN